MSVERDLLLAIDGGQTSTKSLIARTDGTIVAAGKGGPSDHFHIEGGIKKNRVAIHGAIDSAISNAGGSPDEVASIALGLTGAPAGGDQNPVIDEIVRERLPHLSESRITIVPDYKTNLAGASGGQPGVVLIAGGGAIAYGYREDGREAIAGGYGYLIGDEGSAFDIGLRAIEAACKSDDLRGESTALAAAVRDHFQVERFRQLPRIVYRAGFSRDRIALLSPRVVEVAERGDQIAIDVLAAAAHELAATALGAIRQLYEPGEEVIVYPTGGVFKAGSLILDPFETTLAGGWPGTTVRKSVLPPAAGALIVAASAVGINITGDWLATVADTLPDEFA